MDFIHNKSVIGVDISVIKFNLNTINHYKNNLDLSNITKMHFMYNL